MRALKGGVHAAQSALNTDACVSDGDLNDGALLIAACVLALRADDAAEGVLAVLEGVPQ